MFADRNVEDLIGKLRENAEATAARYAEIKSGLDDMRVTVKSTDGEISVTVRSNGKIEHIGIDDSALRRGPRILGEFIVATIQRARAEASVTAAERVQELTGPHMDILDMVGRQLPTDLRADLEDRLDRGNASYRRRGGDEA